MHARALACSRARSSALLERGQTKTTIAMVANVRAAAKASRNFGLDTLNPDRCRQWVRRIAKVWRAWSW
jgi:hypothetical protein